MLCETIFEFEVGWIVRIDHVHVGLRLECRAPMAVQAQVTRHGLGAVGLLYVDGPIDSRSELHVPRTLRSQGLEQAHPF